MSSEIVPDDLVARLYREMSERMQEADRLQMRMAGIDPDNRETVMVEKPRTAKWLADRDDFQKRFDALVAEGESAGFLYYDHCYECGGPPTISTDTTEWVSEPNPHFDPAKPKPEPFEVKSTYGMKTVNIPKETR